MLCWCSSNQNGIERKCGNVPFEKGREKTGGRKKGQLSGRAKALQLLLKILGEDENLKTLERALQTDFDSNPIKFFKDYGIDLAPKGNRDNPDAEGVEQSTAEICADMDKATIGDKPDV